MSVVWSAETPKGLLQIRTGLGYGNYAIILNESKAAARRVGIARIMHDSKESAIAHAQLWADKLNAPKPQIAWKTGYQPHSRNHIEAAITGIGTVGVYQSMFGSWKITIDGSLVRNECHGLPVGSFPTSEAAVTAVNEWYAARQAEPAAEKRGTFKTPDGKEFYEPLQPTAARVTNTTTKYAWRRRQDGKRFDCTTGALQVMICSDGSWRPYRANEWIGHDSYTTSEAAMHAAEAWYTAPEYATVAELTALAESVLELTKRTVALEQRPTRIDAALLEPAGTTYPLDQAQQLAKLLHAKHYADVIGWRVADTLLGALDQIDNMTAGMVRERKQPSSMVEAHRLYVKCELAAEQLLIAICVQGFENDSDAEKVLKSQTGSVAQFLIRFIRGEL